MDKIDQEVFKEGIIIELHCDQPKLETTESPDEKKIDMSVLFLPFSNKY